MKPFFLLYGRASGLAACLLYLVILAANDVPPIFLVFAPGVIFHALVTFFALFAPPDANDQDQ